MKTVWKYGLPKLTTTVLEMPVGAEFLHTAVQDDVVTIWALVNPAARLENRTFTVYGTGHVIQNPDDLTYLGSCLEDGGRFVWHVFENTPAR